MSMPAASVEGHLVISLRRSGQGNRVRLRSSRPLLASRLFEGKPSAEALRNVPLLFNVCGQAQGVAAVRAVESAQGKPACDPVELSRDRLVRLETLSEHLCRVLTDWPRFIGDPPDPQRLAALLQALRALRDRLDPDGALTRTPGLTRAAESPDHEPRRQALQRHIAHDLYGCRLQDWLGFDASAMCRWIAATDTPATRLLRHVVNHGWASLGCIDSQPMPWLDNDTLITYLDGAGDDFIAHPHWHGANVETGPSARLAAHPLLAEVRERHGNGLLARLLARLIEIAQLAIYPDTQQTVRTSANGLGISQLEASRGRLCHRVILDGGRVTRYRILAPTEWNFRPDGPAAQALATVDAHDHPGARRQAELLIHAADPCVSFQLDTEFA